MTEHRIAFVVSDQAENNSCVTKPGSTAKWTEQDIAVPIGSAAAAEVAAAGYRAMVYNPHKTYSLKAVLDFKPEVIVLIHLDYPGHTRPQGVMGVRCGHSKKLGTYAFAQKLVKMVGDATGFGIWSGGDKGISTDEKLRGFCYYFFKRMREVEWKGESVVLELGNMRNANQVNYLVDNSRQVGKYIAQATMEVLGIAPKEEEEAFMALTDEEQLQVLELLKLCRVSLIAASRTDDIAIAIAKGDVAEAERLLSSANEAAKTERKRLGLDKEEGK